MNRTCVVRSMLFVAATLLVASCAESKLQKRIDAARLAGDDAEVARLEAELPAAAAQDADTWTAASATVGAALGIPFVSAFVGAFMRRRGVAVGVRTVARAIEAGKSASPEFRAMMTEGIAHDTIKTNMPDSVKAIVKEVQS